MGEAASNLPARLKAARLVLAIEREQAMAQPQRGFSSAAVVGSKLSPEGVCLFQRGQCIDSPALLELRTSQTGQRLRV